MPSGKVGGGALPDIKPLEKILEHDFEDRKFLTLALTHPSVNKGIKSNNQRLEFLGDRVLGLIVTEMLYATFKDEAEGALAKRLAFLVQQSALASVAEKIDLASYLRLSKGEHDAGGRGNPAILADACEAVIGALYLDGGLATARNFVSTHWVPMIHEKKSPPQDAKTALQEWAQGRGLPLPIYVLVASEGPAHDPVFCIEASLPGIPPERAQGKSKRQAEQLAASGLLKKIRKDPQ